MQRDCAQLVDVHLGAHPLQDSLGLVTFLVVLKVARLAERVLERPHAFAHR